jgi:hypothetical protein
VVERNQQTEKQRQKQAFIDSILKKVEQQAYENLELLNLVGNPVSKEKLMNEIANGLEKESFRMYDKIKEYVRAPLNEKPDFTYTNPDLKIIYAKFVLGGLIIAFDENHNIMIFNDRCEKLQMLPYGKRAMDAVASDTHIFIGMYHNKVLILERKFPFTVVSKVDTDKKILCMCRNELHEIRVCGEDELSFYINEHTFEKKFTKFSSPYFTIV